jgi:hypothetical protein
MSNAKIFFCILSSSLRTAWCRLDFLGGKFRMSPFSQVEKILSPLKTDFAARTLPPRPRVEVSGTDALSSLRSSRRKTPLQERRRNDRGHHDHHEDRGEHRLIEDSFSLNCKAKPDACEDQSDFAARNHVDADRDPAQIFADRAKAARRRA